VNQPTGRHAVLSALLARTEAIADGLRRGEVEATALPGLLHDRLDDLIAADDTGPLSPPEADLIRRIADLDSFIVMWCEQSIADVRERLARTRRTASPSARLISESA
jgi:hypothetical protein